MAYYDTVNLKVGTRVRNKLQHKRQVLRKIRGAKLQGEIPKPDVVVTGTVAGALKGGVVKVQWDDGTTSFWTPAQCDVLLEKITVPIVGGERVRLAHLDETCEAVARHFGNTGRVLAVLQQDYKDVALVLFDGDDDPWYVPLRLLEDSARRKKRDVMSNNISEGAS